MLRALLVPAVLMSLVGFPMLYRHHQMRTAQHNIEGQIISDSPVSLASTHYPVVNQQPGQPNWTNSPSWNSNPAPSTAQTTGDFQNWSRLAVPGAIPGIRPASQTSNFAQRRQLAVSQPPTAQANAIPRALGNNGAISANMVPDFGQTETLVFRGDANGPDLSAPMSFVPITDPASLFRFDINKQWIMQRWDRVSTCPGDSGLHGLRVPLVTGTSSWDLHGSMTWYFDSRHQLQRITYRGWTGDASRLVQLLGSQYGLKPQPTHWAGLYLSNRGGLLMQHPAVIDKANPMQQLALILEINNPKGRFSLSENFQSLLPAAQATQ